MVRNRWDIYAPNGQCVYSLGDHPTDPTQRMLAPLISTHQARFDGWTSFGTRQQLAVPSTWTFAMVTVEWDYPQPTGGNHELHRTAST